MQTIKILAVLVAATTEVFAEGGTRRLVISIPDRKIALLEDGKVVKAGSSADSLLVQNVAHVGDEDMWMPPPDNKDKIPALTKEQIGLIRAWIDQGAK